MGGTGVESTENEGGNALLKTQLTRRTAVTAAAWSAPVVAMAAATPAVAASGTFKLANLKVDALGAAEGLYETGHNFTPSAVVDPPNNDFRQAFYVKNTSTDASFTGTLKIDFRFPGAWNEGVSGNNVSIFDNRGTVDTGGENGGVIGGKTSWAVTEATGLWTPNTGTGAWSAVHQRMDYATFNLTGVELPPGGVIWFALNASIPESWIGSAGPPPVHLTGGRIYWRSDVDITAITDGGDTLGPYRTPVGGWADGIWYFNGGGPVAYDGGHGLYPAYPTP